MTIIILINSHFYIKPCFNLLIESKINDIHEDAIDILDLYNSVILKKLCTF